MEGAQQAAIVMYVIVAAFGLAIGSFLNVCIWRMPRSQSIISPGSRCPSCGMPIRAIDNVPVLSYLLLGGRCRFCKAAIPLRYPAVETLNALLYVLVYHRMGIGWHLPVYLVFVSSLVVITFIDLDFQIIPDVITIPGIPLGLAAGSLLLPDPFLRSVSLGYQASFIGAGAGFGFFLLVAIASRGGMGGGDIKLMGMVGAALGWKAVLLTTLVGSFAGSVVGLFLVVFKGKGRKSKVPFGPFLALGALVSLLWGQELLRWYSAFYEGR